MGIFRDVQKPTYDDLLMEQIDNATAKNGRGELSKLLNAGSSPDTHVLASLTYNQAIADAQAYFLEKASDLDGVRYEAEFDFWKGRPDA